MKTMYLLQKIIYLTCRNMYRGLCSMLFRYNNMLYGCTVFLYSPRYNGEFVLLAKSSMYEIPKGCMGTQPMPRNNWPRSMMGNTAWWALLSFCLQFWWDISVGKLLPTWQRPELLLWVSTEKTQTVQYMQQDVFVRSNNAITQSNRFYDDLHEMVGTLLLIKIIQGSRSKRPTEASLLQR